MGVLRIIRYGTEYSLRTKRIIFFIIFFIALTGVTLYAINEIGRENTDLLLSQKVVILEQANGWDTVIESDAQLVANKFTEEDGAVYVIRYIHIDSLKLRIFSLDLSQPWANSIVQPDEIRVGSYITNSDKLDQNTFQVLASRNLIELGTYNGFSMQNTYSVGSIQKFNDSDTELTLQVVGLFDKEINLPKDENWLMIPDSNFDMLTEFLTVSENEIYAYQIVITASGYSETFASMFFGDSIKKIEANRLKAEEEKGTQFKLAPLKSLNDIKSQATSTDIILIVGLIGSPIVATLYAVIISKIRTREIAVLKAVGYSNNNVQITLLTEIGTVSIIGFIISVFSLQILLALNAQYTLNTTYVPLIWNPFISLIPSPIAIATFIFIVISNIFGFVIISRKSISVRPVELFKNAG